MVNLDHSWPIPLIQCPLFPVASAFVSCTTGAPQILSVKTGSFEIRNQTWRTQRVQAIATDSNRPGRIGSRSVGRCRHNNISASLWPLRKFSLLWSQFFPFHFFFNFVPFLFPSCFFIFQGIFPRTTFYFVVSGYFLKGEGTLRELLKNVRNCFTKKLVKGSINLGRIRLGRVFSMSHHSYTSWLGARPSPMFATDLFHLFFSFCMSCGHWKAKLCMSLKGGVRCKRQRSPFAASGTNNWRGSKLHSRGQGWVKMPSASLFNPVHVYGVHSSGTLCFAWWKILQSQA